MGKTTAGRLTSANTPRWTNVYQNYIAFYNRPVPKPFALYKLTEEIGKENEQLCTDLGYLESYYGWIQHFLDVAWAAKTLSPNDATAQNAAAQELQKTEAKLCSKDTLLAYLHAAIGALRALASIAEKTQTYIGGSSSSSSSSSSKLSGEESELLTALLDEVKSISKNVKEDFVAEVSISPGESLGVNAGGQHSVAGPQVWDAYVRERPGTLLALRAVGGTENMPPLPPTPGT